MSDSKLIEKSDPEKSESDLSQQLKNLVKYYLGTLSTISENNNPEFEIRFGTRNIKRISKSDFNNVIGVLYNYGFKLENETLSLKILLDDIKYKNTRCEINSMSNIQKYCETNNLDLIDEASCIFQEKKYYANNGKNVYPINFDDFNFRASFQIEKHYNKNNEDVDNIIKRWSTYKKIFRYIKRYHFKHDKYPFNIHCSVVKVSNISNKQFIASDTIQNSNVFNNNENYEIEIEIDNNMIEKYNKKYASDINLVYTQLKTIIKYVLIGLQQSNYPIGFNEQNIVYSKYLKLIKNTQTDSTKLDPKVFIGPSSVTLQKINIIDKSHINITNENIPNIRNDYCVTDKADGLRKLLYIDDLGKIYLINTSMIVEYTGTIIENKEIFNTLIDGEHIIHDKNKKYINLFACFDIYYIKSKSVTGLAFAKSDKDKEKDKDNDKDKDKEKDKDKDESNYRLNILNSVVKLLNEKSTKYKSRCIKFKIKKFYSTNIFTGCSTILSNVQKGLYEYTTDGLIFTPVNTGVASKTTGVDCPNFRVTWNESFKWKPPEYNTIDFFIKFKKTSLGGVFVGNIANTGTDLATNSQVKQYIQLILHVGFDEKRHGYINPCQDIIDDNIKKQESTSQKGQYIPVQFYPTNPSDTDAGICNVMAYSDKSNVLKIYTEEGDEIEDNSIVEFKYDIDKNKHWNWIPIRNRYDKTYELRNGNKNYGNAYHVANQNWQSIHNPITDNMISSGTSIDIDLNDDDVYYNKVTNQSETRSLRDFHNLYVKSQLISLLANEGSILIDYAVGKGGDLPKWIASELSFVMGIDVKRDNIENRMDGACARYLNYASKFKKVPNALFIHGNSSLNIKSGDAIYTDKYKNIVNAIFGVGAKNREQLGSGVYKNYGVAKNGFNISSIQFAFHYMFESKSVLQSFLKNVSECTCKGGYFIGTCYNGKKIFNMLKDKQEGESISIIKNDKKIWQITKQYTNNDFLDDETSLGYAIDVYQETINKTFREYLVNFEYLTNLMEDYGFVVLDKDELDSLKLENSVMSFEKLYTSMTTSIEMQSRNKYGSADKMSTQEKTISFLNNCFIYKKVRDLTDDPEKIVDYDKDIDNKISKELENLSKDVDDVVKQEQEKTQEKLDAKIKQLDSEQIDKPVIKKSKEEIAKLKEAILKDKLEKQKAKEEKAKAKEAKAKEKEAKAKEKEAKAKEKEEKAKAKEAKAKEKEEKAKAKEEKAKAKEEKAKAK